jgi:hypothetical protein
LNYVEPGQSQQRKKLSAGGRFQMKVTRPPEAQNRENAKAVVKPWRTQSIEDALGERLEQHATPEISPKRPKDGPLFVLIIFLIGMVPYIVAGIAGMATFATAGIGTCVYIMSCAGSGSGNTGLAGILFVIAAAVSRIVFSLFRTKN